MLIFPINMEAVEHFLHGYDGVRLSVNSSTACPFNYQWEKLVGTTWQSVRSEDLDIIYGDSYIDHGTRLSCLETTRFRLKVNGLVADEITLINDLGVSYQLAINANSCQTKNASFQANASISGCNRTVSFDLYLGFW